MAPEALLSNTVDWLTAMAPVSSWLTSRVTSPAQPANFVVHLFRAGPASPTGPVGDRQRQGGATAHRHDAIATLRDDPAAPYDCL